MDSDMITKTKVKERGWTETGIKKFLGKPDATKTNPMYRSAAPMSLYKLERIEMIEKSDAFVAWRIKSDARKVNAAKAVATKKDELLSIVNEWKPVLPTMKLAKVKKQAIYSYNDYNMSREDHKSCDENSDPLFLERIMVNYIRHELTNYDDLIERLHGLVGKGEAMDLVREKVYSVIAIKYPCLSDECSRQQTARTTGDYQ